MFSHAEYHFIRHQDVFQSKLFQMFHLEVNDPQKSTYYSALLIWFGCVGSFRLEILKTDSRHYFVDNGFAELVWRPDWHSDAMEFAELADMLLLDATLDN